MACERFCRLSVQGGFRDLLKFLEGRVVEVEKGFAWCWVVVKSCQPRWSTGFEEATRLHGCELCECAPHCWECSMAGVEEVLRKS